MQALAFIKLIDIVDDRHLGLSLILKLPMVDQFILQRTEEAFDRCIVITITLPTHTGDDATQG